MDELLFEELINKFGCQSGRCPFSDEMVWVARRRLADAFGTEAATPSCQAQLFRAILTEAKDPDKVTLPDWLEFGFPFGIDNTIDNNNVFPETDEVSASIRASQALGTLLEDWEGDAHNYKSFEDAGEKGQAELERLVQDGRAIKVSSWTGQKSLLSS